MELPSVSQRVACHGCFTPGLKLDPALPLDSVPGRKSCQYPYPTTWPGAGVGSDPVGLAAAHGDASRTGVIGGAAVSTGVVG